MRGAGESKVQFGMVVDDYVEFKPAVDVVEAKIKVLPTARLIRQRSPVAYSLPIYVKGISMYYPDLNDSRSVLAGAVSRMLRKHPKADEETLKQFGNFVAAMLERALEPLPHGTDLSVRTWLAETNYSDKRKKELLEIYENMPDCELPRYFRKTMKVKQFVKEEGYTDFKYHRMINARSDRAKVLFGPLFKCIEKVLFGDGTCRDRKRLARFFIKKVPVADRPRLLAALFRPGAQYIETDHTSFESAFVRTLMMTCEIQLYRFMVRNLDNREEWYQLFDEVLAGGNICENKFFVLREVFGRMSGEMCTSLGNGFTNLMVMLFIFELRGIDFEDVEGYVEGDDGIFVYQGSVDFNPAVFAELGFTIKFNSHQQPDQVGFCGLRFVNLADRSVCFPDVGRFFASFGFEQARIKSSRKRAMELLRAKALSGFFQYQGVPVIEAFCRRVCYLTRLVDLRKHLQSKRNLYRKEILDSAVEWSKKERPWKEKMVIDMDARYYFERMTGINVEAQLRLENYYSSIGFGPCEAPADGFWPKLEKAWEMYVGDTEEHGTYLYRRPWDTKKLTLLFEYQDDCGAYDLLHSVGRR